MASKPSINLNHTKNKLKKNLKARRQGFTNWRLRSQTMNNEKRCEETARNGISRRQLLTGIAGFAGAGVLTVSPLCAKAASFSKGMLVKNKRHINMRHIHTGETYSGVYRIGDNYIPQAFEKISRFLRDFRTGDVYPMDPRVVDILWELSQRCKSDYPLEILSGYRSERTNARLSRSTDGVALNSLHMSGQALDIRLPYFSTRRLRDIAVSLQAGGVGYYPSSDFVHVDTGEFRTW
mgnify:FL=1